MENRDDREKPARPERKCEREFRKLFENTFPERNKNSSEKMCPYLIDCPLDDITVGFDNLQRDTCKQNSMKGHKDKTTDKVLNCFSTENNRDDIDLNCLESTVVLDALKNESSEEEKCRRVLEMAICCMQKPSASNFSLALEGLKYMKPSTEHDTLMCISLLLYTIAQNTVEEGHLPALEEHTVNTVQSFKKHEEKHALKSLSMLLSDSKLKSRILKLSQKIFTDKNLDYASFDVPSLCCCSLGQLLSSPCASKHKFSNYIVTLVLEIIGSATQDIIRGDIKENRLSVCAFAVNQCLTLLRHMLFVDPDLPWESLDCTNTDVSILHCLTRLLGWCTSLLFEKQGTIVNERFSAVCLPTLLSILHVLSVLFFNSDQYDTFTNTSVLMEKLLVCILKSYFHTSENRFDVIVLALELFMNFFFENRRTFTILCLKKFAISEGEQVLSIVAFIKILERSIAKINAIKEKPLTVQNEAQDNPTQDDEDNLDLVLEAADEDMEQSTIVAFVGILVALFMRGKPSFKDFVKERMPEELSDSVVSIAKKVLDFGSITGGMPQPSINLMNRAIRDLTELHQQPQAVDVVTIAISGDIF